MTLCLFEDALTGHLAPLSLTRAVFDLRVGARTLLENAVDHFAPDRLALHTREIVAGVTAEEHPGVAVRSLPEDAEGVLFVNGAWLVREGEALRTVQGAVGDDAPRAIRQADRLIALWHPAPPADLCRADALSTLVTESLPYETVSGATLITRLWHLIDNLSARITYDLRRLGGLGDHAGTVHERATLTHETQVHLADKTRVAAGAVLNASTGPVRLETGATIEANAVVDGPCWLGPGTVVKAGARLDASAVGERSKIGGEVHGTIVHSFSNKAHDGYLGNSYLGRWCNLGADTNTSNLKNDYGEVTLYDAPSGGFVPTGRQFLGLVMGDHAKCSINSMFNTGTVVGVFCNLFGAGFPPRHVPSFSWGGADGFAPYRLQKAYRVAEAVMARRDRELTEANRHMLTAVFEQTASDREAV